MEQLGPLLNWLGDDSNSRLLRVGVALLAIPGALWGVHLFLRWLRGEGIDRKIDAMEAALVELRELLKSNLEAEKNKGTVHSLNADPAPSAPQQKAVTAPKDSVGIRAPSGNVEPVRSSESADWEATQREDSAEGYRRFLRSWRGSRRRIEAETRLIALAESELPKIKLERSQVNQATYDPFRVALVLCIAVPLVAGWLYGLYEFVFNGSSLAFSLTILFPFLMFVLILLFALIDSALRK